MARIPRRRLPRLATLVLILAAPGVPALAQVQDDTASRFSAEDRASLPPVDQFKDGDEWDSYDEAESLADNATVFNSWIVRNGEWQMMKFDDAMAQQQLPADAVRKFVDPRSFTLTYPQNPTEGMFFAGGDGI